MKEETQASKFEGTTMQFGSEAMANNIKRTCEALADEITRRFHPDTGAAGLRTAALATLLDWFLGDWTPGGPTDPPHGAPAQTEKPRGG